MIPCVYCLTSTEDQIVYEKIFNHLVTVGSGMNICYHSETLTCDFKVAAINAFSKAFPKATLTGCFFHYLQDLWRKVQYLKLTRLVSLNTSSNDFSDDDKKSADYWLLAAVGLALIPPSLVDLVRTEAMNIYTPESSNAK